MSAFLFRSLLTFGAKLLYNIAVDMQKKGVMELTKDVKMQDIADRLGVSVVAVSKALSGKSGVSDRLREDVRRTAKELGYSYSVRRRQQSSLTGNISVLGSSRFIDEDSFYLKYYKHISAQLQSRGRRAFFNTITPEWEEKLVFPSAMQGKADGAIILGQLSKGYIELISSENIPMVFLDFYDDRKDIDCIISDSFYASYDITNFLINIGHSKLAFVGSVKATSSIQDRYLGYMKSLMEHNIHVSSNYVLEDRDVNGMMIPIALPVDMPTAFVCNCDNTAYHLINQLKKEGYRIPQDISVTGFDNSVYSEMSDPKITTIEVNTEQMSALAVDTILKKIENPAYSIGRIPVGGRIIYKNSVRALRNF